MAYDPSIYHNIPETEHTSLKSDFAKFASKMREFQAMQEPYLMFSMLSVMHEIILNEENSATLEPLEAEACRLDYLERQHSSQEYSSEYLQALKVWRRAILKTAKELGYQ